MFSFETMLHGTASHCTRHMWATSSANTWSLWLNVRMSRKTVRATNSVLSWEQLAR